MFIIMNGCCIKVIALVSFEDSDKKNSKANVEFHKMALKKEEDSKITTADGK